MYPLQIGAPGVNELALLIRVLGHLLACVVATAVAAGASGRRIRPIESVGGGMILAVVVPVLVFGAQRLELLAPVVAVTENVVGTYAAVAAVVSLAGLAIARAAWAADLTDPAYPGVGAALRANLSTDDAVGVLGGTVALVSGEVAALTVVSGL